MQNNQDLVGPPLPTPHRATKIGVFILAIVAVGLAVWAFFVRPDSSGVVPAPPVARAEAPDRFASPKPNPPNETLSPVSTPRAERAARPRATAEAAPANVGPTPLTSSLTSVEVPKQPAVASQGPARAGPPVPAPGGPIYDVATTDVTPPALLTPMAIAPVRTDSSYVSGLAAIEIIVNGDGSVQSVKAGRQPATIGETLEMVNWLSITKSWRFGPAVKNGQPVKYRLVVPLSALVSGRGIR